MVLHLPGSEEPILAFYSFIHSSSIIIKPFRFSSSAKVLTFPIRQAQLGFMDILLLSRLHSLAGGR